jgi:hypothetical protein
VFGARVQINTLLAAKGAPDALAVGSQVADGVERQRLAREVGKPPGRAFFATMILTYIAQYAIFGYGRGGSGRCSQDSRSSAKA